MKQRKVATRSNNITQKLSQIDTVLRSHPEGMTPKHISALTRININTVKSLLPKIENVKKIMRGVYKVVNMGDTPLCTPQNELSNWNFHNLILSTTISAFPRSPIKTTESLNLINLEFIISTKGRVTCRLATDYPCNVSSIVLVAGMLKNFIYKHTQILIRIGEIVVQCIEFNRDYANLKLEGVQCITLDSLSNQFKLYQKKRGLRVEHKTKVKFSVENLVDMLGTNPNSLELGIKLSKQKEQLDRLTQATSQNTQLLFKTIDAMKQRIGE